MHALLTDLYQLTMAAGYVGSGKAAEIATFELFVRRLPRDRNYMLVAGLPQVVEYLRELRFTGDEIAWLRTLPQFARASERFFDCLRTFRFTGDLDAMPEGTPAFPNQPLLRIRAPLVEAQVAETYVLAALGFQTMIASKAARVAEAAQGRRAVEMGTRRAHSPEAGVLAGRAAYLGGCDGTSNVEAGFRYGVPVYGTSAHSWVTSFPTEREAFQQLQRLLGPGTVHLIDTYDTVQGARHAAELGAPLWGVRLDSGDLGGLSRQVRRVLDDAGLREARIMATGDLNEHKIAALLAAGAPIDSFGVGTELATSADAPALPVVYKLVELESQGVVRYTAKRSDQKGNLPGAKQVFRRSDHDVVARDNELLDGEPLLQPMLRGGEPVMDMPDVATAREKARRHRERLPHALRSLSPTPEPWRVEASPALRELKEQVR